MNKPPVVVPSLGVPTNVYQGMIKQRDADYEHQQKVIGQIFEKIEKSGPYLVRVGIKLSEYRHEWQSLKSEFLEVKK